MPIVKQAQDWTSPSTNVTVHNVALPPDTAAGDVLVSFVAIRDSVPTITWTAGWLLLGQAVANNSNPTMLVLWKVATGDDVLSVSLSIAKMAAAITYCVGGADYVDGALSFNSSANSPTPAFTSVSGALPAVFLTARVVSGNGSIPTALPSGFSQLVLATHSSTSGVSVASGDRSSSEQSLLAGNWTVAGTTANDTATIIVYDVPKIIGRIRDETGVFVSRQVSAHNSVTGVLPTLSGGRVQSPVMSDPSEGRYSLQCPNPVEHFVVVRSDDPALPALVSDRRVPA